MNGDITRREQEKIIRENRMIDAAEELFLEKGFDGTSVDEIGRRAQFTKRTIYQYFVNKEDLFYAVVLRKARELQSEYDKIIRSSDTALNRIRKLNRVFYSYYLREPEMYALTGFNPPDGPGTEKSPRFRELAELKANTTRKYGALLEEGKRDGSISETLDVKMASHFGMITSLGILGIIAKIDAAYWAANGLEREKFIEFSFDLLSGILRAAGREIG